MSASVDMKMNYYRSQYINHVAKMIISSAFALLFLGYFIAYLALENPGKAIASLIISALLALFAQSNHRSAKATRTKAGIFRSHFEPDRKR